MTHDYRTFSSPEQLPTVPRRTVLQLGVVLALLTGAGVAPGGATAAESAPAADLGSPAMTPGATWRWQGVLLEHRRAYERVITLELPAGDALPDVGDEFSATLSLSSPRFDAERQSRLQLEWIQPESGMVGLHEVEVQSSAPAGLGDACAAPAMARYVLQFTGDGRLRVMSSDGPSMGWLTPASA
ncbi:MAG: hypothetical protein QM692_16910 [Thermomicrobiales bacterium]